MKDYKVILVETVEHEVIVNAKDESEIEDKLIEMLGKNEVDFAKGKSVNVQIRVEK